MASRARAPGQEGERIVFAQNDALFRFSSRNPPVRSPYTEGSILLLPGTPSLNGTTVALTAELSRCIVTGVTRLTGRR